MRQTLDLSEMKFGKLSPKWRAKNTQAGYRWVCLCDCGNFFITAIGALRAGRITHCGCDRKARSRNV